MTATVPTDPGVQVATGDPSRLQAAAGWHNDLADGFDAHAATIASSAASISGVWDGEAANSYQRLSAIVAAHFRAGADRARTAAATLRRFADTLERCQREGTQARHQAEHWLQEVTTDTTKLQNAQTTVTNAQTAVTRAVEARRRGGGGTGGGQAFRSRGARAHGRPD
ncbi:MAG: hypothetical protein WCB67_04535 [Solirubrobacteraceae bacterium]